jgi:hypothetical protein
MEFESPAHSVWDVIGVILVWAFGCAAATLGVWLTVTDWPSGGIIAVDILVLAPSSLIAFWMGWRGGLHLKVELSSSPREARCCRRNVFTRLKTYHRYSIRDDAKVIFTYKGVGGDENSDPTWPVYIEGLPKYYDFYILGRCRDDDDAWAISRALASFLGIRLADPKGHEYPVYGSGMKMWYGPRPEVDESQRRRRRRQRRKRA